MTNIGTVKLSDFGVAKILPDIEDCRYSSHMFCVLYSILINIDDAFCLTFNRSTSGTHGYMVST